MQVTRSADLIYQPLSYTGTHQEVSLLCTKVNSLIELLKLGRKEDSLQTLNDIERDAYNLIDAIQDSSDVCQCIDIAERASALYHMVKNFELPQVMPNPAPKKSDLDVLQDEVYAIVSSVKKGIRAADTLDKLEKISTKAFASFHKMAETDVGDLYLEIGILAESTLKTVKSMKYTQLTIFGSDEELDELCNEINVIAAMVNQGIHAADTLEKLEKISTEAFASFHKMAETDVGDLYLEAAQLAYAILQDLTWSLNIEERADIKLMSAVPCASRASSTILEHFIAASEAMAERKPKAFYFRGMHPAGCTARIGKGETDALEFFTTYVKEEEHWREIIEKLKAAQRNSIINDSFFYENIDRFNKGEKIIQYGIEWSPYFEDDARKLPKLNATLQALGYRLERIFERFKRNVEHI